MRIPGFIRGIMNLRPLRFFSGFKSKVENKESSHPEEKV